MTGVRRHLRAWGWDDEWEALAADLGGGDVAVGRVVEQARDRWLIQTERGPGSARIVSATRLEPYPAVGDWVVVEPGPTVSDPWSVHAVLPRRSAFSRGTAGSGATQQVLAANVDVVWIVHGLDMPINARRLERYLAIGWESGATPEVVLTKADLATDPAPAVAEASRIAVGAAVHVVSIADPASAIRLRDTLPPGRTVALLGPSGAGKSTLVNVLGEADRAATAPVRDRDHKGRHTTTRRELFRIPSGALLLDTPGIRELRVWELGDGLEQAFPEIEELSRACRFGDCRHESEPGCAVLEAAASGRIDAERLTSFRKLRAEAAYQARKNDPRARKEALSAHKSALKTVKYHHKFREPD